MFHSSPLARRPFATQDEDRQKGLAPFFRLVDEWRQHQLLEADCDVTLPALKRWIFEPNEEEASCSGVASALRARFLALFAYERRHLQQLVQCAAKDLALRHIHVTEPASTIVTVDSIAL